MSRVSITPKGIAAVEIHHETGLGLDEILEEYCLLTIGDTCCKQLVGHEGAHDGE